ncbi:hypothetical protein DN069_28420 [Streptacidiphilus pinicola]|uniref:FAD dependent oxidoreductase domain-containing protein n=1 Tax=Streptacidiphilus pinicola TaxID=2219663 RepID=A0A2X0IF61_9ACTN|nr:FAD-dependent oxidoreductase [Streptacidiphilus pinicola]RAG82243.1 hypothetical protein DN069_28420 [Streptacidiphilus pinicola]
MTQPCVVIVGGGVLGASIASALASRSVRPILLDAAEPGQAASAATFAWVNAQKKSPESYFRLNHEGIGEYHRLAEAGVGKEWFHAVGNVEVATDAESSAALDGLVEGLVARGYAAERITARRAAELEPFIDPDRVLDAAWFPAEGWVDTEQMVAGMLEHAVSAGATVRPHTGVTRFETAGARTRVVLESGDEILADEVVCAAGAATQGLLAASGVEVPLVSEADTRLRAPGDERYTAIGGLADTAPLRRPLRRVLHTPDMGLRPTASGRVVMGGDGAGSRVPRTDAGVFGLGPMLLERARKTFPVLDGVPVERVRVGVRPMPADGRTVAGFTDAVPGLYTVVTHSGVTLAPYLARLVVDELMGDQTRSELADFRPGRFAHPGA